MNKYNPLKHHRCSIRLKEYDYSKNGLYYITICIQNRECLFGEITNDEMILNDAGKIAETEWLDLKIKYPNIDLHEQIIRDEKSYQTISKYILNNPANWELDNLNGGI